MWFVLPKVWPELKAIENTLSLKDKKKESRFRVLAQPENELC